MVVLTTQIIQILVNMRKALVFLHIPLIFQDGTLKVKPQTENTIFGKLVQTATPQCMTMETSGQELLILIGAQLPIGAVEKCPITILFLLEI